MDEATRAAFVAHIQELERRGEAGDLDAIRSLACMVLIAEGSSPNDPDGGGEVIDFLAFLPLKRVA